MAFAIPQSGSFRTGVRFCLIMCWAMKPMSSWGGDEPPVPLLEREPFDRVVLTAEGNGQSLDVFPFQLEGTPIPSAPKPDDKLRVRLLASPIDLYDIKWKHIAKIETHREIILAEIRRLIRSDRFDDVYPVLERLLFEEPDDREIAQVFEELLFREAGAQFRRGKPLDALAELDTLRQRRAEFPGLDKAVVMIVRKMVESEIEARDYARVRSMMAWVRRRFARLVPDSVTDEWNRRLTEKAGAHVEQARALLAEGNASRAITECRVAMTAQPELSAARELYTKLIGEYPVVSVAVTRQAPAPGAGMFLEWSNSRVSRLTGRAVVEQVGAGAEGGEYISPLGELSVGEGGQEASILLGPDTSGGGPGTVNTFDLSRRLLLPRSNIHQPDWTTQIAEVDGLDPRRLRVRWSQRLLRGERWLTTCVYDFENLPAMAPYVREDSKSAASKTSIEDPAAMTTTTFASNPKYFLSDRAGPREVIERCFADSQAILAALQRGEVDVIDRLDPLFAQRLGKNDQWTVSPYRVPSTHFLVPNTRRPLAGNRTFRRGLLYGTDRQTILNRDLLGGDFPGCVVLSSPAPVGADFNDPLGYAHDRQIVPVEFDPYLGLTLCRLGRDQINVERAKIAETETPEKADKPDASDSTPAVGTEPLVLCYPADPMARAASAAIAAGWSRLGIATELRQLPAGIVRPPDDAWDFLYCDVVMAEPWCDLQILYEPGNVMDGISPYLALALRRLRNASNWDDARKVLGEIHRLTYEDVTILPLWQIQDFYAFERSITGIVPKAVTLYQSVESWTLSGRSPAKTASTSP